MGASSADFSRNTTSRPPRTIRHDGGEIEIEETGLYIDVPSDAIDGNSLTITVTALRDAAIAYDFEPHGMVFPKPLDFQQDFKNTHWET